MESRKTQPTKAEATKRRQTVLPLCSSRQFNKQTLFGHVDGKEDKTTKLLKKKQDRRGTESKRAARKQDKTGSEKEAVFPSSSAKRECRTKSAAI